MINVLRYDGISLTTGFPINVSTLNSGISANIFTINISSIRLWDKSKIETVLHSISVLMLSYVLNELCDKFNVFKTGSTLESQFSIVLI